MNSVNAKILKIEDRVITISVPHAAVTGLLGKDIKLDGFSAGWLNSPPSKEADDDESKLIDALAYRVEGKDDIGSLTVASICEVTWV
jgi:hypothetical protein